ncbi:MAG TPA: metal-dependent hydrolase, partial [Pyrinomonadaceae bacterium]|nr:metal-dependent hydrolase [Pyrinomonadaceae bacterium]
MDNLTHSLVGFAAAKAGLERLSPAATWACLLAANAPDVDIVTVLGGRWVYLHHHRGITHSIIGTLALAVLLPCLFYLGGLILARLRQKPLRLSFRGLLLASLIVSATHPLMDWTNNYGVRPLLPWSAQWYYGDLVFIVDPWLWLSVGGATFLLTAQSKWRIAVWTVLALILTAAILYLPQQRPNTHYPALSRALWITGLTGLFFAHRAGLAQRWGRSIAISALALIVLYWGGLSILHGRALERAQTIASHLATQNLESLRRVAAMPTLANPLRWRCVAETNQATYLFHLSLLEENSEVIRNIVRYERPQGDAAEVLASAAQDWRAQIFLDFAR